MYEIDKELNEETLKDFIRDEERKLEEEKENVEKHNSMLEVVKAMGSQLRESRSEALQYREQCEKLEARGQALSDENKTLKDDNKALREEIKLLQMQQSEQSKLTSQLMEKADHEDLIKGISKYLKLSKRKNSKKKGYIRMTLTELCSANNVTLPEDVQALLNSFDDEEPQTNIEQLNMGNGIQLNHKDENRI